MRPLGRSVESSGRIVRVSPPWKVERAAERLDKALLRMPAASLSDCDSGPGNLSSWYVVLACGCALEGVASLHEETEMNAAAQSQKAQPWVTRGKAVLEDL